MTSTLAFPDLVLDPALDRFYPPDIPSFPNEPIRGEFAIRHFGARGRGVCTLRGFDRGMLLFAFSGIVVPDVTQFSLRLGDGRHIHDPWFMGLVLHSCEPNASCDVAGRTFTALRTIASGEAITMDYESTEDVLFRPFRCRCGSTRCRRVIAGRKALRG